MKTNSILIRSAVFTLILALLSGCVTTQSNCGGCHCGPTKAEPEGFKIGLSMYSLRKLFKEGKLTAFDYPKFAKEELGITEIDVWDGAFPKGKKDDINFYKELKKRSDAAGTNIFLVMTGAVNATGKTPEERKKTSEVYFKQVDYARILGADFVRIFLNAPNTKRHRQAVAPCIEALKPLADYAQENGVVIVIEPGSSKWAREGYFLANLAKTMNHPALKLMPDFGKLRDPYNGTHDMMPYSVSVSAKSYNFDEKGNEKHFDYFRLIRTVNDFKYNKIVAVEYEGHKAGPVEGVLATKKLLEKYNANTCCGSHSY